jgi:hypothetical protein
MTNLHLSSPQPIIAKVEYELATISKNYPFRHRLMLEYNKNKPYTGYEPITVPPIGIYDFFMLDYPRIKKILG